MKRAKKYHSIRYHRDDPSSDFKILHNLLPTPEIFHMQAISQNTIGQNHYGPSPTKDPSALSRSADKVNMKVPTDWKDVSNYYHLSRSMTLFWEAQVLDCWVNELGLQNFSDIAPHFQRLQNEGKAPSFDELIEKSENIVRRFMSYTAYDQALDLDANNSSPASLKFTVGAPFIRLVSQDEHDDVAPETEESPAEAQVDDVENVTCESEKRNSKSKRFEEVQGFNGDRVLANSILFKTEYSFWIELAYAVPKGDFGRVWEMMKILMYIFPGGGNTNYRDLLLDLWCLFKYETSKNLKDALWNNILVNLTGELGKWIPADLMQEHYNRWLEDLVDKSGGSFDSAFMRKLISPNVDFFLWLKEAFEVAADLHQRSKLHTSPHLRDEYRMLLVMYAEDKLHTFRSGRSYGHAAINLFARGEERIADALDDLLQKHTRQVELLRKIDTLRKSPSVAENSRELNYTLAPAPSGSTPCEDFTMNLSSPVPTPPSSPPPPSESGSSSSESGSSYAENEPEMAGNTGVNDDDEQPMEKEYHSRLKSGPEFMPSIDNTGRLIDWLDDEELEMLAEDTDEDSEDEQDG
ncbi:hypothetical protein VNI00_015016 [Paramarasmius palmivorus]|uniref:DUF6589 domain-containing protein n=1 Tax=Paramarasmius palmivorus TaxID=297713 RepID=A0AAW0BR03_9AGAR